MKTTSQNGSYQDFIDGRTSGKKFTFRLVKKNANATIINSYNQPLIFVGQFSIPNIAVINEKDNAGVWQQKTIRYIPGEPSIYKDKQSNDKDVPKKNYKIKFINGRKIIEADSEPLLLEFLMKVNSNMTNPNRRKDVHPVFELVDNALAVSKEIAKDKLISEVTGWCWNGEWEEVKAYARVLTVPLNQSPDEVRHHLKVIAMRDPEKFIKELKNPAMRKKHYVLEAIDRGYLVIDPASNSISWSNNQSIPIAVAAIGVSPVDVLVNKLSTDEGALMYNTLLDMMAPEKVITTQMIIPSKEEIEKMKQAKTVIQEPVKEVTESDAELMDILEEALALGLVTFKLPMWYSYKDEPFKKKEGFVEGLRKEPRMLKNLRYEIDKSKKSAVIA